MKIHGDWVQLSRSSMAKSKKSKRARSKSAYGYRKKSKGVVSSYNAKNTPQRMLSVPAPAQLTYSDHYTLNPGVAGAASTNVFRLQSIFDPDLTGVGHQPPGHDELANLYERYQVWKVDFKVSFVSADVTLGILVGYSIGDTTTVSVDHDVYLENGQCDWGFLGPSGSNVRTFTGSVKPCDVHGVSYLQYMANDDEYGAPFGSNPNEGSYFKIFAAGVGNDTGPAVCQVQFIYHTKLMGGKLTAKS